jgi:hypothetical protein
MEALGLKECEEGTVVHLLVKGEEEAHGELSNLFVFD